MNAAIVLATQTTTVSADYIAGAIIALLILAYLIYSLIKPEKF